VIKPGLIRENVSPILSSVHCLWDCTNLTLLSCYTSLQPIWLCGLWLLGDHFWEKNRKWQTLLTFFYLPQYTCILQIVYYYSLNNFNTQIKTAFSKHKILRLKLRLQKF
jgi:hypothetical protein